MRKFFFIVLMAFPLFACVLIDGTTIEGERGSFSRLDADRLNELENSFRGYPQNKEYLLPSGSELEKKDEQNGAVALILRGQYAKAVEILLKLEQETPGNYAIASNLGTAYELLGDNEKALKWIEEGIARNANAHYGTEWLHVEILKTKIKLRDDPDFLKDNHVVDISRYSPYVLKDALFYQLNERMLFVKPKDPVVADLLFTYAMLESENGFLEVALQLLEWSESYGYANPGELSHYRVIFLDIVDNKHTFIFYDAAAILGVIIFLLFAYKKKWFSFGRQAPKEYDATALKTEQTDSDNANEASTLLASNVIYFTGWYVFCAVLAIKMGFNIEYVTETDRGLVVCGVLIPIMQWLIWRHYDIFLRREHLSNQQVKSGTNTIVLGYVSILLTPFIEGLAVFVMAAVLLFGIMFIRQGKRIVAKSQHAET